MRRIGVIPNNCKCLWIQVGAELAEVQLLFLGLYTSSTSFSGACSSAGTCSRPSSRHPVCRRRIARDLARPSDGLLAVSSSQPQIMRSRFSGGEALAGWRMLGRFPMPICFRCGSCWDLLCGHSRRRSPFTLVFSLFRLISIDHVSGVVHFYFPHPRMSLWISNWGSRPNSEPVMPSVRTQEYDQRAR